MKKLILIQLLLLSFFSSHLMAQFIGDLIDPMFLNSEFRRGKELDKIDGTPFLNQDWKIGKIKLTTGQVFDYVRLKYDIYNDEIVVVGPDNKDAALNKSKVESFIIYGEANDAEYTFLKFKSGDFYNLAYQNKTGRLKVLQKFRKKIHVSQLNSGAYGSPETKKSYVSDDRMYIQVGDEEFKECDKEKKLYEIFPQHAEEIKSFIKTQKIKLKGIKDLVEVVKYIDTL